MYRDGTGVKQDYMLAAKWYTAAAQKGNAMAQNNLAVMLENGDGVARDYNQAIKWYTAAAKQGHIEAQFKLDNMYCEGSGVKQDYKPATQLYTAVIEQDLTNNQDNSDTIMDSFSNKIKLWLSKIMIWLNIF